MNPPSVLGKLRRFREEHNTFYGHGEREDSLTAVPEIHRNSFFSKRRQ